MNGEKLILKKKYVDLYNKKMNIIEKDIWDIIDNFEYYKMIRGIMYELQKNIRISKRQVIRLYEFLTDKKKAVIKKTEIDEIYNRVFKEMFETKEGLK